MRQLNYIGRNAPNELVNVPDRKVNKFLKTGLYVRPTDYGIIEKASENIIKKPVSENAGWIDNYLAQNSRTVVKSLKEDRFEDDTLNKILGLELNNKNRQEVLEQINIQIGVNVSE